MQFNYKLICDVEIDGIDYHDAPDFCDAYITSATYDGKPMSDDQLDQLNEDRAYLHEQVINTIY